METKNDKFKRLANKRVPVAIEKIELIQNLSNKNNYDYSQKEADEIIKALTKALSELKKSFNQDSIPKFKI